MVIFCSYMSCSQSFPFKNFQASRFSPAGIRVAADLFHVPVPGLFGSRDPYHLIAFKEDSEVPRAIPDAQEDQVPSQLVNLWRLPRSENGAQSLASARSVTSTLSSQDSASTGRSSCVQVLTEMKEMTLLVDTDTELHDVQEAHIKFQRDEDGPREWSMEMVYKCI